MDMIGILDPDPDPHENLCGSETLCFSHIVSDADPHGVALWQTSLILIQMEIDTDLDPDSHCTYADPKR